MPSHLKRSTTLKPTRAVEHEAGVIRVYGHRDWSDGRQGVGQGLLVSLGYEPVVSDMRHREAAFIETRLGVLRIILYTL